MKTFSFYHADTGIVHPAHFIFSDESMVEANTPVDHIAIEGHHDEALVRVDVATGDVVPHPAEHLTQQAAIQLAQQEDSVARSKIMILERMSVRAMRELLLTDGRNQSALDKLRDIDSRIAAQRAHIVKDPTQ